MRKSALCWSLVISVALAGCSTALADPPKRKPLVQKSSEHLSRGLIQEGLETLDTPENRARLGRILGSQSDAVRDLSEALVLGMFDAVGSAGFDGVISREELAASLSEAMDRHVTPAMARLARRTIDSALDSALSDTNIGRLETLGERSTHAAIRGLSTGIEEDLGPALAAALEEDIGPALAIVVERDLLPAVARGIETPEMQRAMSTLARSLATEFVTGAGDAINGEAQGRKLTLFGNSIALGYAIALFVAFALGTASIVLTVMLVRQSRRLRTQNEDASERETALLNLIDSLETDNPELKADLRHLLEDQIKETE